MKAKIFMSLLMI